MASSETETGRARRRAQEHCGCTGASRCRVHGGVRVKATAAAEAGGAALADRLRDAELLGERSRAEFVSTLPTPSPRITRGEAAVLLASTCAYLSYTEAQARDVLTAVGLAMNEVDDAVRDVRWAR